MVAGGGLHDGGGGGVAVGGDEGEEGGEGEFVQGGVGAVAGVGAGGGRQDAGLFVVADGLGGQPVGAGQVDGPQPHAAPFDV